MAPRVRRQRGANSTGDAAGAARDFALALKRDRFRETGHRGPMRAQADPGKTSAALAQFEKCRTILKTQLGVEPDAETRSLAALIRASRLRNPAAPEPGFQRFPSDRAITVFRAGQGPSARLQDLARGSAPDALQAALDAARAERTPQSPAIRVMTNGWPRPPLADMGPGFLVVPEVYRLFENWSPF